MIKDISNANENVTANSYEIQKLKQALPQCFTSDGSFNMEAFKNILQHLEEKWYLFFYFTQFDLQTKNPFTSLSVMMTDSW